jgi:hypothetical protein
MWPLGAVAGAGWANSGEARRILAGEGHEEGLGVTRVLFGSSVGGERRPVGGAPAASGGGSAGVVNGAASYGREGEVEEGPPWLAVGRD